MLFSSPIFLFLFLPLVLAVYFAAPRWLRNGLLTLASLWFYAWGETVLVAVMLISIGMNHAFGLRLAGCEGRRRGWVLAAAVTANLLFLAYFKYAPFLVDNYNALASAAGWPLLAPLQVSMPIGISFYTFQAMSYVIDVYRRQVPAERSLVNVAMYIALFPQLIAGPIVRYVDIASQIRQRQTTVEGFAHGVERFVVGLSKKMLLANPMAAAADAIFEIPDGQFGPAVAWLGLTCYTLQIYFDFSGYSDMAIGLGRMFGFRFLENFNYPYIAGSIQEFWRRWHISLSTWFRDYLYIPLGGNRGAAWQVYRNLLIVFVLCGLWHGASWNFVAWGLYHGAFLVFERRFGWLVCTWPTLLRHTYALLAVMGGWVLFRATSMTHALAYLQALCGLARPTTHEYHVGLYLDTGLCVALAVGVVAATPWLARLWTYGALPPAEARTPAAIPAVTGAVRLAVLASLLAASSTMMVAGTYNPFIYFRF